VMAWIAFAVASASLVGLPPTGGFAGKWWLAQAALATGGYFWLAVLLLGTTLTAAYLWRALQAVARPGCAQAGATGLPGVLGLSALVLALGAAGLGLAAPIVARLLETGSGVAG
jgi:multicomponent Na+:H+ antiporter subunit D